MEALHKDLADLTFHAVVLGSADFVGTSDVSAELAGLLAPGAALWVRGVKGEEKTAAWMGEWGGN